MSQQSVLCRRFSYNDGRCEESFTLTFNHRRRTAKFTSTVQTRSGHFSTTTIDYTFEELALACANVVHASIKSNEHFAPLLDGTSRRKRTRDRDAASEKYRHFPIEIVDEIETRIGLYTVESEKAA